MFSCRVSVPRSEASLLASSKQHRIQRRFSSWSFHVQSADPRAVKLTRSKTPCSAAPYQNVPVDVFHTHLVSHYGEVIHPQLTGVHSDFPQSLRGIGVDQDPEPLLLLVEGFDSVANPLDRLER